MKNQKLRTLPLLLFLQIFSAVSCFGLDSILTEHEALYYTSYLEEPQDFGYRIFYLDPVSLLQVKTEFKGGFATLYDSPRKLQWQDGMLYFLDGRRNPNTSHQGMMYRYDQRLKTIERVCAFEAEDYTLTEDGIWIVYGGQLCMVRSQTMLSQNIYRGQDLRRIESDSKHLYILEDLADGESAISIYNPENRESRVLARGAIADFTLHEGSVYYYDSETLRLMEIRLSGEGEEPAVSKILEGAASAPKFDSYGYLYYLGDDGNLRAFIRDDQLFMKIADGPFLDWRPAGDYVYIAKEVERSSHFLVDMRNGNHIPLESLEGSIPNAGSISQAAADEQLDRKSYRTVPGEVYHVLAGVRWYEEEGGSLLFNRLDGKTGTKSWFVDFPDEEDAAGYVWPENCNIALRKYKPGSGRNVMEEGWLREHDALLPYRESYPVSGYTIEVLDTLESGSPDDAARLVMDLEYLFRAPMMIDDAMIWRFENDYNPEKQTLSFSVELAAPCGVASEWDFSYSRNPETGAISHVALRFFHANLSGYEETADVLTENFNNLFLYRLFNYLNIYHTEKWPGYTLRYPDAILRFNSGESGGGYGFTIELM